MSVLALSDAFGQYIINTDVCDTQVGCVLLQKQEEKVLNPADYWSKALGDTERRYDTTPKKV